jgi:hypothetical protein
MVDRAVDVLGGVLEGDSKTVEAVSLDVDINVPVLVAAGSSGDSQCDESELAIDPTLVKRQPLVAALPWGKRRREVVAAFVLPRRRQGTSKWS